MAQNKGGQINERDKLEIALRYQRIKDGTSNESIHDLCTQFGCSRNMPANISRQIRERGTVQPMRRPGRPSVVNNLDMQERLVDAIRANRSISSRQLGRQLGCSNKTACTLRRTMKFKAQGRKARPPLSASNMEKRLQWCRENATVKPHTAFLDEKWWCTFRAKKKVYRRSASPPIYHHPPAHSPKAMFISVVSRDAPQGKVGIWPVAQENQYQRHSKYHSRGDFFWKDFSCHG